VNRLGRAVAAVAAIAGDATDEAGVRSEDPVVVVDRQLRERRNVDLTCAAVAQLASEPGSARGSPRSAALGRARAAASSTCCAPSACRCGSRSGARAPVRSATGRQHVVEELEIERLETLDVELPVLVARRLRAADEEVVHRQSHRPQPIDQRGRRVSQALDLKLFNHVRRETCCTTDRRACPATTSTPASQRRAARGDAGLEPDKSADRRGSTREPGSDASCATAAQGLRSTFRRSRSCRSTTTTDLHSDTRLIRRITRDRRYRCYSAAETISSGRLVRRGEMRHIFPSASRPTRCSTRHCLRAWP